MATTMRASNSFSERECIWLDEVLKTMLRGGDTRILARAPELGVVARRVRSMRESLRKKHDRKEQPEVPALILTGAGEASGNTER